MGAGRNYHCQFICMPLYFLFEVCLVLAKHEFNKLLLMGRCWVSGFSFLACCCYGNNTWLYLRPCSDDKTEEDGWMDYLEYLVEIIWEEKNTGRHQRTVKRDLYTLQNVTFALTHKKKPNEMLLKTHHCAKRARLGAGRVTRSVRHWLGWHRASTCRAKVRRREYHIYSKSKISIVTFHSHF